MPTFYDEPIPFIWIQGVGSQETLHRNGPGLSFADSYLGQMVWVGTQWGYKMKGSDDVVVVGSYQKTKRTMLEVARA